MNALPRIPVVPVATLALTGDEMYAGVILAHAFNWAQTTTVLLEDADGVVGVGNTTSWPNQGHSVTFRVEKARSKALSNLRDCQRMRRNWLAKYPAAAPAAARVGEGVA